MLGINVLGSPGVKSWYFVKALIDVCKTFNSYMSDT